MKAVLCLALIICGVLAINADYLEGHDGRPACKTDVEMENVFWRNNNDPTLYWVCSELNVAASTYECTPQTAFLSALRRCVEWSQWQWEEPVNPPSMAF